MLAISVGLITIQFSSADESTTIWTTDEFGNPVYDFDPGVIVYIHGSGFTPGNTVNLSMTRPDGVVETAPGYRFCDYLPIVDVDGTFSYTYDLDGIYGLYILNATDGIVTATTTFTDATKTTTTLDPISSPLAAGQTYTFSGTVTPNVPPAIPDGATVELHYDTDNNGNAPYVAGTTTTSDGNGGYSGTFTAPSTTGTYYFRAEFPKYPPTGNAQWAASESAYQTISVAAARSITVTTNPSGLADSIVVDTITYTSPHTFIWAQGSSHTIAANSPVYGTGIKYVYTGWSDGGGQSHSYIVPSSSTTVTANYDTYYKVHYTAIVPVTVPADEWILSGQAATGVFPSPVISDGTKYVFVSDNRPATITAPTTITATYDTYYWVTYAASVPVTLPSNEWVKSGNSATGVFPTPVTSGDTKYAFVSDNRPGSISGPTTITATYDTYYWVQYATVGNENPITLPANEWVLDGNPATGTFPAEVEVSGVKDVLVGDDRPTTITDPTTITTTYDTYYWVTFRQTGLDIAASGTVLSYQIDGGGLVSLGYTNLPSGYWIKSGSIVTYTYSQPLPGGIGKQFGLASVDGPGTGFIMTEPETITGNYVVPVVNAGSDATINEGDTFTSSGSFTDLGALTWTATVNYGDGSGSQPLTLNPDKTFVLSHVYADNGVYIVTVIVTDNYLGIGSDTVTVTVNNVAPVVNAGPDATINEGSTFSSSGSFIDPGADIWIATVNYGDGSGSQPLTLNPDKTFTLSHPYIENGIYTVTITITDDDGGIGSDTATVTVNNVAPTITSITVPVDPVKINVATPVSATFTDPGTADTHTASWIWGDGTSSAGVVTESSGSGSITGSHTYTATGVYLIILTVDDDDGDSDIDAAIEYIVVYDPSAGFVTGGGWINSPPGAYPTYPTLTGKATFGFVSKYKKGASVPDGETQFVLHMANLNFHSTSYDWLVIAGSKAKYKGTGTINGQGEYKFILTAIDGGKNSADGFRIKIWDADTGEVIYDNQMGANDDVYDATDLAGGSIVIHK